MFMQAFSFKTNLYLSLKCLQFYIFKRKCGQYYEKGGKKTYRTNQENRLLMSNSTFMLTASLTAH